MENEKIKILYIDDEVNNLSAFKANFRRIYEIHTAESAAEGRKILETTDIEIIITDQRMPEMTGVEFLESIVNEFPNPMRILLTGYTDMQALIDAVNKGQIYRYLNKPWNEEELKMYIAQAYEVYSLRKENMELTKSLLQANKQLEFMLRQKLLS
ncbi:MAG TPA: response regulator [Cytophagaceae bacterium]|jgi:response regulator RpfG family c-di-GMP phosphodiesterase|nr:response regulator [Cytophagaceae bacterium]